MSNSNATPIMATSSVLGLLLILVCDGHFVLWFMSGDEVAILEFHGFSSLCTKLSTDDNFATFRTILHDETHNTIASAADSKAAEKLVAEGLCLCHGASCTILDALSEEFHAVLWEIVSFLHNRSELTNAAALLAQHLARACRPDDDLCSNWGHPHLHTGIAIFCQSAHQELIELCVEDAIGNKLTLLRNLSLGCHISKYLRHWSKVDVQPSRRA